jgi:hypothetical protein
MQVKVEKCKGEKALEAGLQQMLAAGWKWSAPGFGSTRYESAGSG